MLFRLSVDMVLEVLMIRLTRLNHVSLVLNSDLIEHIEETPDTVVTLTTGQILRVRESADQVVARIVEFRRRIFRPEDLLAEGIPEAREAAEAAGKPGRPETLD
jgi:flagellar protein FlbD